MGAGPPLFPYLPPFRAQAGVALDAYDFVVLGGGSVLTQDEYACQLDATRSSGTLLVFGSGTRAEISSRSCRTCRPRFSAEEGATMSMSLTDAWKSRFRRAKTQRGWCAGTSDTRGRSIDRAAEPLGCNRRLRNSRAAPSRVRAQHAPLVSSPSTE